MLILSYMVGKGIRGRGLLEQGTRAQPHSSRALLHVLKPPLLVFGDT